MIKPQSLKPYFKIQLKKKKPYSKAFLRQTFHYNDSAKAIQTSVAPREIVVNFIYGKISLKTTQCEAKNHISQYAFIMLGFSQTDFEKSNLT